ncbi:DnaJ family domain-containing protein [Desulfosarcina variabilis]|uniref:DnaJ family domain-containing protein n=1 Tax=Desulfosarcina variabilis TaxID=2300 RepID=UPI003AFA494E
MVGINKPVTRPTAKKTTPMFPGFEQLIEARIKKAQDNGAFEDLPGSGEPLDLEDDRHIPEDLRMAHKILKNAGCTPPEVQLRKEIRTTEDLLANMTDTEQKYRTIKKLNYLVLKLNAMRNTNTSFDIPQRYYAEVVDRLEPNKK